MEKKQYGNMDIWDRVCETDPRFTKEVNQRGGFTAIAAQWQIREATRLWGPYGANWGVRDCNYAYVFNAAGEPVELYLEAVFFYPRSATDDPWTARIDSFEISCDIKYKPGDDCRKKLLTDLTTKALSKLGFSADVFMNKFADNKYVSDLTSKFTDNEISPPSQQYVDMVKKMLNEAFPDGIVMLPESVLRPEYNAEFWMDIRTPAERKRFVKDLKEFTDGINRK